MKPPIHPLTIEARRVPDAIAPGLMLEETRRTLL
jgi:hypothetical protein